MGFLDWIKRGVSRESPAEGEPSAERQPDPNKGEAIHDALANLSVIVNAMEQLGPKYRTWQGYLPEFESAVGEVRQAIEAFAPAREADREAAYVTHKGNAIHIEGSGPWTSHESGLYETREHIGRSVEGVHGGIEFSPGKGTALWSEACRSESAAWREISFMRDDLDDYPVEGDFKTKSGNTIDRTIAFGWRGNHHYVFNERVGASVEGFHGGLSVSWRQGDLATCWGDARETFTEAEHDAKAMRVSRCQEMDKEVERIEANMDVEWER